MRSMQCVGTYSRFPQITKCLKTKQVKTAKHFSTKLATKFPYLYGEASHPSSSNEVKEYKLDLDPHVNNNNINIFNDRLILSDKLKSNKIFSAYTKSYINKESEHILILCLKKINEYEKNKDNIKISVFIYELQNLSKSKIRYNVLKNIKTIKNFLDHINNNIHTASPSLLLSTAISYKNIRLNKYTYFKNILKSICNHIKVYKSNKLSKLLKSDDNDQNNKDDYQYTIQLLNKKKKNHKINMLNVYTNHLNNSALSYILHSYSSLFNVANYYLLYICKYILLNVGNLNYLDMLSLLYFMNRSNIKISKSDILSCLNNNTLTNTNPNKNQAAKNNYNDKKGTTKNNINNTELNNNTNGLTPNGQIVIQNVTQLNNSNIKYSEYKNTYIKILRTIIHLINKKPAINENTNVLILILYYYFKMNLIPIQIFYKLHYRIKKNIKNIDIKYISLYLYILSNIKFNLGFYKFIYKYLADVFTNRTKEFNTLSLCLSFYSLSKNEYYDDKFVNSCLALFRRHAESLNDVNITNIIYTLGKLKKKDDNLFDILCEILTRRIENISAINLSLIVHSLSKVHYQNAEFYKICLDKGKELLCSFTAKQLIVFTTGLVMNNIYDFEFMQLFFNHIISIDSDSTGMNKDSKRIGKKNNKQNNMLSIICFSTVLERENFIKQFPLSINTFISKNLNFIQCKEYTTMHDEILNILNYLNVDNFEIVKEKKPYMFDIFIKGDNKNIYIDILSRKKYLACSENLNGFMELKKRHMKLLNGKYYYFDKDSFISLDSIDKKTNFIKNFLQNICFYNFNALNHADELTKRDITNLIYSSQNEKKNNIYMKYEKEKNSFKENSNYSQKLNNSNCIQNRNYFLFPTYSKIENVEKNLHKKNKNKIDYGEPLIKKHQIFIDYDQGILLNQTKVDLINKSDNAFQNIQHKDNNTYLLHNENNFLFSKKCHGLTKFECVDKKSGKIIIKKNKLFW
ncbi:heptatricopeptide repeat-containing protein, putative [Plasmodium chabaudi chabaudi]|uniref:Heptatricopeptide repeat-containing protein, putative n=1 Tax=Plasmodium chabaudi chabaudi TaxID=31271 RepID=A0A4V0K7V0_PLACU|nr:heptatricopeptide repeat-containing protein, putative [Plasmodium chabaudi chabaudi]VTZ69170.1 heptatricopeptide repeat-containing protein, putative [Plasmodium chabaudi chabaudi]|eukprot:XP_743581.2 conserved Plasmodium protein, unknown function [Plasmodium chabaudi chabaudi]